MLANLVTRAARRRVERRRKRLSALPQSERRCFDKATISHSDDARHTRPKFAAGFNGAAQLTGAQEC